MCRVLQKAIDHMHMTFDETDVMRDSLQMIEREYACSRIKNVHDFIVHVEIYGGAIERPVELLLADKKRWEQRICGSMKERRKMFVDIVMSMDITTKTMFNRRNHKITEQYVTERSRLT